jgi:aldose sugar dehydrogenase
MVCMKSILVTNSYSVVTIKIANTIGEMKDAIFANGFGRITDLEIGPDGYMYVLSSEDDGAILYKISKAS